MASGAAAPTLPTELLAHIFDESLPALTPATLRLRNISLTTYSLVCKSWHWAIQHALFKHVALPTPLDGWHLAAATSASWGVRDLVGQASMVVVGRPSQDTVWRHASDRQGELEWWRTAGAPTVPTSAFEDVLRQFHHANSIFLSGLGEVDLRLLRAFIAPRSLHINACRFYVRAFTLEVITRLTLIQPHEQDLETRAVAAAPDDDTDWGTPEPTYSPTLRHLIIGEPHDCDKLTNDEGDLNDYSRILSTNFGETARLESFAVNFNGAVGLRVGAFVLAYVGILKALEESPLLEELKKLSIREVLSDEDCSAGHEEDAEVTVGETYSEEERAAREALQALCDRRGIDLEERILSSHEPFVREQWSSYTRPFDEL
ncbi:hypothetical protein RQP46_008508 [Phenoliferia psychrophenolica]